MHIEIENTNLDFNHFPNKRNNKEQWFTVVQGALLFRDGEKYPDKFDINLYFQSHQELSDGSTAQNSIVAIKAGKYQLEDKAFRIDQHNQLEIDVLRLKAI